MASRLTAAVLLNAGLAHGSSVITDVSHGDHFDLDVMKVKEAAALLLVDGKGTSKEGTGWLDNVSSIDRNLVLHWDISPVDDFDDGVLTCNKTWTCADMHYETCPNMTVTTAQVRGFVSVPDDWSAITQFGIPWGTPAPYVFPTFEFDHSADKKYSLLMVDLSHKGNSFDFFPHSVLLNMESEDVSTATYNPGFTPSANPSIDYNYYTFLLFEHTEVLSGVYDKSEVTLKALMAKFGLTESMLVAVNWYRAKLSVASFPVLDVLDGFTADTDGECPKLTGEDMCNEEIDTVCADFIVDDSTTSSAGRLMGTLFAFVSCILHCFA